MNDQSILFGLIGTYITIVVFLMSLPPDKKYLSPWIEILNHKTQFIYLLYFTFIIGILNIIPIENFKTSNRITIYSSLTIFSFCVYVLYKRYSMNLSTDHQIHTPIHKEDTDMYLIKKRITELTSSNRKMLIVYFLDQILIKAIDRNFQSSLDYFTKLIQIQIILIKNKDIPEVKYLQMYLNKTYEELIKNPNTNYQFIRSLGVSIFRQTILINKTNFILFYIHLCFLDIWEKVYLINYGEIEENSDANWHFSIVKHNIENFLSDLINYKKNIEEIVGYWLFYSKFIVNLNSEKKSINQLYYSQNIYNFSYKKVTSSNYLKKIFNPTWFFILFYNFIIESKDNSFLNITEYLKFQKNDYICGFNKLNPRDILFIKENICNNVIKLQKKWKDPEFFIPKVINSNLRGNLSSGTVIHHADLALYLMIYLNWVNNSNKMEISYQEYLISLGINPKEWNNLEIIQKIISKDPLLTQI